MTSKLTRNAATVFAAALLTGLQCYGEGPPTAKLNLNAKPDPNLDLISFRKKPVHEKLWEEKSPLREFDSKLWISDKNSRINMVADLIHRHPLIGMQRDEIRALLGNPVDSDGNYVAESGVESYEMPAKTFSRCWTGEPCGHSFQLQYADNKLVRLRISQVDWTQIPGQVFASEWVEKNYSW